MAEARYATPDEVESQAEEWSEGFLECRLYGHPWKPGRATFNSRFRYYYVVQVCPRCVSTDPDTGEVTHTERHAEINERGHVLASWMKYSKGYLTKEIGRIVGDGRDTLRLAALTRVYDVTKTRKIEKPHSLATRRELGMIDG